MGFDYNEVFAESYCGFRQQWRVQDAQYRYLLLNKLAYPLEVDLDGEAHPLLRKDEEQLKCYSKAVVGFLTDLNPEGLADLREAFAELGAFTQSLIRMRLGSVWVKELPANDGVGVEICDKSEEMNKLIHAFRGCLTMRCDCSLLRDDAANAPCLLEERQVRRVKIMGPEV